MENRNRNTAILLIITGLYFLVGKMFGFMAVSAVILIWLGIYKVRSDGSAKGYIVLAAGAIILLGNQLSVVIALILFSLGYFLIKSRSVHRDGSYSQRQTIVESIRWDREPWVPKNMSHWCLLGEIRMDLSLAMQDEEETIVMLQGVFGDIDIIVPVDFGLSVEANVLLGRIGIGDEKDSGLLNKRVWQSANYADCAHKMKLIVSYAVGDIEVKTV